VTITVITIVIECGEEENGTALEILVSVSNSSVKGFERRKGLG
jgi:hypothetical protein